MAAATILGVSTVQPSLLDHLPGGQAAGRSQTKTRARTGCKTGDAGRTRRGQCHYFPLRYGREAGQTREARRR